MHTLYYYICNQSCEIKKKLISGVHAGNKKATALQNTLDYFVVMCKIGIIVCTYVNLYLRCYFIYILFNEYCKLTILTTVQNNIFLVIFIP